MRKTALSIVLAATVLVPALASAQASVELRLALPVVLPQLVVVSPGVQVVPDVEEEVFFTNGYYWVRHDNGWYRSRSHRGGWVLVGPRAVPARLVKFAPGHYRRWKPAHAPRPAAYRERDDDRRERSEKFEKHEKHEGKKHGKHGKHD